MKRTIISVLLMVVVAGTLAFLDSQVQSNDQKWSATLVNPRGVVQVQAQGQGDKVEAKNNQAVFEGDVIYTRGGGSSVLLKFDDGSMVKIGAMARLAIDQGQKSGQAKKTSLDIGTGKVWSRVNRLSGASSFSVKTPTAIAGVRGTYYSSQVDNDDSSRFNVFEGSVAVSSRKNPEQQVLVNRNQTTSVAAGKAPEAPSEIPADELEKEKEGFSDNEFTAASYSMQVSVYPPQVGPGQKATVTVQVFKNGAPAQEEVHLTVTLGGSATFESSGSNEVEVDTNNKGVATLEVVSEQSETVTINVKMKARVKRVKSE